MLLKCTYIRTGMHTQNLTDAIVTDASCIKLLRCGRHSRNAILFLFQLIYLLPVPWQESACFIGFFFRLFEQVSHSKIEIKLHRLVIGDIFLILIIYRYYVFLYFLTAANLVIGIVVRHIIVMLRFICWVEV